LHASPTRFIIIAQAFFYYRPRAFLLSPNAHFFFIAKRIFFIIAQRHFNYRRTPILIIAKRQF
jgi:hypothetical protein